MQPFTCCLQSGNGRLQNYSLLADLAMVCIFLTDKATMGAQMAGLLISFPESQLSCDATWRANVVRLAHRFKIQAGKTKSRERIQRDAFTPSFRLRF